MIQFRVPAQSNSFKSLANHLQPDKPSLIAKVKISYRHQKWQIPLSTPTSSTPLPLTTSTITGNQSASAQCLNHLLALAITNNSHLTIPHLVSMGGSVYSDPASTVLLAPATFPALITLITKCEYDVNVNLDWLGTYLILSIKRNHAEEVRALLSYGANPNLGLYARLYSALASAAEYDASLDIVDELLRARATVRGSGALHVAAVKGRVGTLRRLLENGANVNEIGFKYAAMKSFAEKAGSGLHFAVDGGREEVVRLLLESGADRQLRDAKGRTALERAREKGIDGIIALLVE